MLGKNIFAKAAINSGSRRLGNFKLNRRNAAKYDLIFKKNMLGFLRHIIYSRSSLIWGSKGAFKPLQCPPKKPANFVVLIH